MPRHSIKIAKTCAVCDKEFIVTSSLVKQKFCSHACKNTMPMRPPAETITRVCEYCGNFFTREKSQSQGRKYCSPQCYFAAKPTPSAVRFRKKIAEANCFGCTFYTGATYLSSGYGQFWVGKQSQSAHRFAYELVKGPIPDNLCVLHACSKFYEPGDISYRMCVNPNHLFLGTPPENSAQMAEEGRSAKGERSGHWLHPGCAAHGEETRAAILKEVEVLEIRAKVTGKRGECAVLGREYGVHEDTIRALVKRRTWKHI